MQEFRLLEMVLSGISILASFLFLFIMIERFRLASGMEMFTDKFIKYLEGIHKLTAPERDEKVDVREYFLTDKVKVMELYIPEQAGDKDQSCL